MALGQLTGRSRLRIGRTVNAVSSCCCNVATLTDLLPSVVHDHAAPVAQYLGAIDNSVTLGIGGLLGGADPCQNRAHRNRYHEVCYFSVDYQVTSS